MLFAQRKVPTYGEPSFIRLTILLAKIRINVIVDTRLSFYLQRKSSGQVMVQVVVLVAGVGGETFFRPFNNLIAESHSNNINIYLKNRTNFSK